LFNLLIEKTKFSAKDKFAKLYPLHFPCGLLIRLRWMPRLVGNTIHLFMDNSIQGYLDYCSVYTYSSSINS